METTADNFTSGTLLNRKPTSNNTGDTGTMSAIRGNGDPAHGRGGLGINEFPISGFFDLNIIT